MAFRYDRMIVAAASYEGGVFPCMQDFLLHLKNKAYQNRRVAIVENGAWAPSAGRVMKTLLEEMKNVEIVQPVVTIHAAWKPEDEEALLSLVEKMTL